MKHVPFKTLRKFDNLRPGFLAACKKIGKATETGLEMSLEQYNVTRSDFDLSRGFGDTIKKLTGKLGIRPCGGCRKRQKTLNKILPYS